MKVWVRVGGVVLGVGVFLAWNLGIFSGRKRPGGEEASERALSFLHAQEKSSRAAGETPPSPGRAPSSTPKVSSPPGGTGGPALPGEPQKPGAAPPKSPSPKGGPASRPSRKKAVGLLLKELASKGVHLDLKKRLVWVPGVTWIHNANLEYIATGKRGSTHETLLVLDCKASALNAALLALGLKPGKNYSLKEKVPPPPKELVMAGKAKPYVLVHPTGPGVFLTVEWKGKGGEPIRYRAEDLVLDLSTKKPLPRRKWIYFGGRWAPLYKGEPPVYVADYEENLISVCYMDPGNHLITIRHEHGLDDTRWWPNFYLLPPKGTPVRLYISLEPLPGTNPPPPPPKSPKGKEKEKAKKN